MKKIILSTLLVSLLILTGSSPVHAQANTISFDSTFGFNGIISNNAPADYNEMVNDMAIQSDGKILIAATSGNAGRIATVIRFSAAGVADSSFGNNGNGYAFLDGYYDIGTNAGAIRLLSNGKMLVSGASDYGSMHNFVCRLDSNGIVDSSFGTNGYTDFYNAKQLKTAMLVLLNDGSMVTAYPISSGQSVLVKLDSTGAPVNSFGVNDSLLITGLNVVTGMTADNDGNILVGGAVDDSDALGVIRILPSGVIDNTFGNNGRALYDGYPDGPIPIVQSDGKILLVFSNYTDAFVVRLLPNGALDAGYGANGLVTAVSYTTSTAVMLMPDDELVIGGDFAIQNYIAPQADIAVLKTSGQLDSVFPQKQAAVIFAFDTVVTSTYNYTGSLKLLPDNKILAAGSGTPTGLYATGFARFNYTGFTSTTEGINNVPDETTMQLYPNPTGTYAILNSPFGETKSNLTVYDMLGNLVLSEIIPANTSAYRVNASSLIGGVYLVEMQCGNKVATARMVVQR